jgi:hypothetical protein
MAIPQIDVFIGKSGILAKPKVGKWLKPFFGYPSNEHKFVQGQISSEIISGSIIKSTDISTIIKSDTIIMVTYTLMDGTICTPDLGILLIYKNLPSVIIFGDLSDKNKFYYSSNRN